MIILGLVGIFLPLFGIQFKLITIVALPLGISSSLAALIFIGAGILLLVIGDRQLRSKQVRAFREAGISGASPEAAEIIEAGLVRVSPTIDEIIEHRHEHVSEETIRRVFPFYGEILRRGVRERYNIVEESIAPRAGVTPDEVSDFSQAAYKATVAREKQERDGQ